MFALQKLLRDAAAALGRGAAAEALELADEATELAPAIAIGHVVRGKALGALRRPRDAAEAFVRATLLAPDNATAHAAAGAALSSLGRVREPLAHFSRALELAPDDPNVLLQVGEFLFVRGDLDQAEQCLGKAAELGSAAAWGGLLVVSEKRGDLEQAEALLRENPSAIHVSLTARVAAAKVLRRLGRPEAAVELLRSLESDPAADASGLHVLGDALEAISAHDRAFRAHTRANARRGLHFDARAHAARIDAVRDTWSEAALARLPRTDDPSERPVFIVGMPRSGTSLVEQILACHPQVYGAGELDEMPSIVRHLDPESAASVAAGAERYRQRLAQLAPGYERVTDKLPHNFMSLGAIAQLFPKARVIHVRREPVDTCLSIYFKDLPGTHDYATQLRSLGQHYRGYRQLMQHWQAVAPLPIFHVDYENLVSTPEPVIRGLVAFLGLPWNERCLRHHESKRAVTTASYAQARRPIYRGSVGRGQRYEAHLGPLEEALQDLAPLAPASTEEALAA